MTNAALEKRLREALHLLESVPRMVRDAANSQGHNAVPFVLHEVIEPFVDETRVMLKRAPKSK